MDIREYLIDKYGYTAEEADKIATSSRMKNPETVDAKLKEMFDFLGFSTAEQKSMISKWPHVLNMSVENIKGKAEFYKENYGITLAQFKNMAKLNFVPVIVSNEKVKELESFCAQNYDMSRATFAAKLKHTPGFAGMSIDSIVQKYNVLNQKYGIEEKDFKKLVAGAGSNFPCVSLEKIDEMAQFFEEEFGIGNKSFGHMLISGKPISCTKEKVLENFNALQTSHDITKKQFANMIYKCPTLICFDSATLVRRFDKMSELGFSVDTIVDNSRALSINSNKMKNRYMMAKVKGMDDKTYLSKGFMYDTRKTYARALFLAEKKLPERYLFLTEKKFQKYTENSTDSIMIADLDMESVHRQVAKQFNAMFGTNLTLTSEEIVND